MFNDEDDIEFNFEDDDDGFSSFNSDDEDGFSGFGKQGNNFEGKLDNNDFELSDNEEFEFKDDDEDDDWTLSDDAFKESKSNDTLVDTDAVSAKKTAKLAIIIGVGILLFTLIILSVLVNRKNNKNTAPPVKVESTGNVSNNTVTIESNKWTQFKGDTSIQFEANIESSIVVTDIKHYASISNNNNDRQLKSIVTGSISGIIGTYELEIPYSSAMKLKVGDSFIITYSIGDYNGYKVIGEIKY